MSNESKTAQPPTHASDEQARLLRDLLAQQQTVQQAQQRMIAQQELDQKLRRAQIEAMEQSASDQTPTIPEHRRTRASRPKPTAIVKGATVDRAAIFMMRYAAVVLLLVSFVGSIVALNGGWDSVMKSWPRPWEGVNPVAAALGVGLQIWITLIEWHKRHHKLSLLYIFHLAIDTALSFIGFYSLIGPLFESGLAQMGMQPGTTTIPAGLIVGVLALVLAMLPEQMLVAD